MVATLYRDAAGHFEKKEYKFTIQEVVDKKGTQVTKPIAALKVNLAEFASVDPRDSHQIYELKVSRKGVTGASIEITITCQFLKIGTREDEEGTEISAISRESFQTADGNALESTGAGESSEDEDQREREELIEEMATAKVVFKKVPPAKHVVFSEEVGFEPDRPEPPDDEDEVEETPPRRKPPPRRTLPRPPRPDEIPAAGAEEGGDTGEGVGGAEGADADDLASVASPSAKLDAMVSEQRAREKADMRRRDQQMAKMRETVVKTQEENAGLLEKATRMRQEARELQTEHANLKAEISRLETAASRVPHLERLVEKAKQTVEELEKQNQDDVKELETEVADLQKQLEAARRDHKRVLSEKNEATAALATATAAAAAATAAAAAAAAAPAPAPAKAVDPAETGKLKAQLVSAQREVAQLKQKLKVTEEDLDFAEEAEQRLESEKGIDANAEIRALKAQAVKLKQQRDDTLQEWEKDRIEAERALAAGAPVEAAFAGASKATARELAAAREEAERVRAEGEAAVAALREELDAVKKEKAASDKRVKELSAEARAAREAQEVASTALTPAAGRMKMLEANAKTAKEAQANAEAERDELEAECASLKKQQDALTKELEAREKLVEKLKKRSEGAGVGSAAELEKLRQDMRRFEEEYAAQRRDNENLREERDLMRQKMSSLETMLSEQEKPGVQIEDGNPTMEGALRNLLSLVTNEKVRLTEELVSTQQALIQAKLAYAEADLEKEAAKKVERDTARKLAKQKINTDALAKKMTSLEVELASSLMGASGASSGTVSEPSTPTRHHRKH